MEQLRAWTLSFCFACIVAGLLGQFSSERKRFSVIKLVLALYILTAALSPLQSGDEMRLPQLPEAAQGAQTPDTGALVMAQAGAQLSETVGQALTQAGIAHRAVDVRLVQEGESIEVERITVTAPPGQEEVIRQTIIRAIGADVPVVLQEEGS
ncbi:MAG: hypothetical protein HDT26_00825 [Subdoligranulum sp.]|nr:hypothetical protein [Subdoligranulum sp.]